MDERVGLSVRSVREAQGLSLRGLAAALELSPATLSAVERGLTPLTVPRLNRIAEVLDVPAAELLAGNAVPREPMERSGEDAVRQWRDFDDLRLDPLLAAATRLFVRQGYHATSMREIAAEAGMSVAGIYHHYPSKERILVALLDLTMAEISGRVEAARQEGRTPVESFALMVESLALFHAVRGDLAFLGASEMRAFSPAERHRITGLRDGVQHALDDQAQLCVGATSVGDLRIATRAIATMCTSLPSWFRPDGPRSAEDVARRYATLAVGMIGAN